MLPAGAQARILLALGFLLCASPAGAGPRSGTLALRGDGRLLLVANEDSHSLSILDTTALRVLAELRVGRDPRAASIEPTGRLAFVANRGDDTITIVDLGWRRVVGTVAVEDEPESVLASSDRRVYVANTQAGTVSVVDGRLGRVVATVATEPDPHGLALASDGATLYVTHFHSGKLSVIDTLALRVEAVIDTGNDSNLSRAVVLDENRGLAYLPQTRSNTVNTSLLFDTTLFPIVSVIDIRQRVNLPARRISLQLADRPVNQPRDVVLASNGRLFILNAGSNDLTVVDAESGKGLLHVEVGHHPTGLALSPDERTLYVHNGLDGSVMALDSATGTQLWQLPVTSIPLPGPVLRGKILFNSSAPPSIARDHWISCASCHPDAETDGHTWFFADGPRNTPSLQSVRDTLPIHWSGDLDELQDVESTVRRIQAGTGLAPGADHCEPSCDQSSPNAHRSRDLEDLAAYLRFVSLSANPHLVPGGRLSPGAERGRMLFDSEALGCAACHPSALYTDRRRHDVGTATDPLETKGTAFDTPSLRGIYKTAPYLHDGSAPNLLEVLTTHNSADRHGKTSQLGPGELSDLVKFLRSLPYEAAPPCTPGPERLCLRRGRFELEVERRNTGDGASGRGKAIPLADAFGAFGFADPKRPEVVVKILPGEEVNAFAWLFHAALTDAEYTVLVRDTLTGEVRRYSRAAGSLCGAADIEAFPFVDAVANDDRSASALTTSLVPVRPIGDPSSKIACAETGSRALCLGGGRLRLTARWRNRETGETMEAEAGAAEDRWGVFWFFAPTNPEIVVEVIDDGALDDSFRLVYGSLTDLEFWLDVLDRATGRVRRYHHPQGDLCGAAESLPTHPPRPHPRRIERP